MKRPARLTTNLLLALASILVTVLGAEAALRVYHRATRGTPILSPLPGYRESSFQRSPFLVFGPRVDYRFERAGRDEWTTYNAQGIRSPWEAQPDVEGSTTVLALGGSTTENVWNELGIHWPLVLECMAAERERPDVRVLNAAMSAYSTAHSLIRYQLDLVDLRPDVVLVMHNMNDLSVNYYAARAGVQTDANYLARYGAKSYTGQVDDSDVVLFRLGHMLASRLRPTPSGGLTPEQEAPLEPGLRIFRRNLTQLVDAIRSSGATPMLLTMPRADSPDFVAAVRAQDPTRPGLAPLPSADRFFEDFDRFNQAIIEVASETGTAVVDVARGFPQDEDHFVDIVHYRTEGVRRFGELVWPSLETVLPAPPDQPSDRTRVSCEGVLDR